MSVNKQLSASAPSEQISPTRTERVGETMAMRLRRLALEHATFFTTPRRELYAFVQRGEHTEAMPLQSRAFKLWLLHCYTQQTQGQLPNPTAMQMALESRAAYA